MDTADIQIRIDAANVIISSKGIREARAQFSVEAHTEFSTCVFWYGGASGHDFKSWHSSSGHAEDVLTQLEHWADALPSRDERHLHEFMDALGNVIDMGRKTGIEVEFVNPLVATMKKLSENALTFRPQAAE